MLQMISVQFLHPHPRNPRLQPRKEIVDQLAAHIAQGFDQSHALIVRPVGDRFEIISGHHRYLAAMQVGLAEVPCWVREFDDDAAYMQLVLCNTQSELHPLEEGKHAAESGMELKTYAERAGKKYDALNKKLLAWEVFDVGNVSNDLPEDYGSFSVIHAAPRWLWTPLVRAMQAENWSVATTRARVAECKGWKEPPHWADRETIADRLILQKARYADIERMQQAVEKMSVRDADRIARVLDALDKAKPYTLSAVLDIVHRAEAEEAEAVRQNQRENEEATARIANLRANCSITEWDQLGKNERAMLLDPDKRATSSFNKQEGDDIEWAQWSWNPVTGCKHECPYCYARDIATSSRMAKVFPNGFEPTFRSNALIAPQTTKVPAEAEEDTRFRNVFTCSMADLFGRWVPAQWIDAVLKSVADNPQWNFLMLTKFPNRIAEFEIPKNAWMGTTVDLQRRVANAEKAFEKIDCGVRWLSIEPFIEPLQFSHLERFNWVVIGGASASSQTPAWRPPYRWIESIVRQCDKAGVKMYFKTNLGIANRILELPFNARINADPQAAPACFHYLPVKKVS